jgi:hypothetical protein
MTMPAGSELYNADTPPVTTRDALMPKLISGEIRVTQKDRFAEAQSR